MKEILKAKIKAVKQDLSTMIPYHSQRTYYEGFVAVLEAELLLLEAKDPHIPEMGLCSRMESIQRGRTDAIEWMQEHTESEVQDE